MGWSWKKTWRKIVRPVTATVVSTIIPGPVGNVAALGISQIK